MKGFFVLSFECWPVCSQLEVCASLFLAWSVGFGVLILEGGTVCSQLGVWGFVFSAWNIGAMCALNVERWCVCLLILECNAVCCQLGVWNGLCVLIPWSISTLCGPFLYLFIVFIPCLLFCHTF